jgi:TPR repeat protein
MKLATTKTECMEGVFTQALKLFDLGFYDLSRELFFCLAEENDPSSLNYLGNMYSAGEGVKKNKKKALFYFEKAARLKDPLAMFNVAHFYRYDVKMYKKALHRFNLLKKDGDAVLELAIMYHQGLGVKRDDGKAKTMLEKLINNPSLFGWMYEADQERAVDLLNSINAVIPKNKKPSK